MYENFIINFDLIFISLATEINNCLIDIYYEDKKFRIRYPQEHPLSVPLSSPLKKEKNCLNFYLLVQKGKKFRKLAKGEINIYKKYLFINKDLSFEKFIYLFTYRNQLNLNLLENSKQETFPGQIFIRCQFLDPEQQGEKSDNNNILSNIEEKTKSLKNAINSIQPKEKEKYLSSIKSKKSNNGESNGLELETLTCKLDEEDEIKLISNNIQNPRKEIDEDLSDISISIDSMDEDENDINSKNIEQVNLKVDDMISKLRKYFDENSESVLPQEPEKLRHLLETLTTQVKNISETYSQNLQSMASINKRLKFQAKDYYDKYKELKANYEKEKKEFLMKNKVLECEDKLNKEENNKISKEIDEVKNEIDIFNNKLGLSPNQKDEETEIMLDILRSLKEKNVDIYEGLNKNQIDFLNEMMKESDFGNNIDIKNNLNNNYNGNEIQKDNNESNDDSLEGEKYAKAIEDIANKIYSQNLIPDIKIEQIENNIYAFNDKEVTLKFDENDQLKLLDGTDLEKWIINSFKIPLQVKSPPAIGKPKKQVQNNKSGGAGKKGRYN